MYIVDFRYSSVGKTFETIELAQEYVKNQASHGDCQYALIAELVEIHKVVVPVEISTITKENIQDYITSQKNDKESLSHLPD